MKEKKIIRSLLKRKTDAHKGDFGHVLVIAGSRTMSGAAVLCGHAALRTGAGLVTIAVPQGIQPVVAASMPEAMTLPLPETSKGSLHETAIHQLLSFIKARRINSIVMGPGLSRDIECRMVVIGIINNISCAGILDADGLTQLAGDVGVIKNSSAGWIITPHPGELAGLIGKTPADIQKDRISAAEETAKVSGAVCVLKGNRTVITDGRETVINKTGNPGMATAGSGDVLSGMIGALLAQGLKSFEAARTGVFLHGRAGDLAVRDKTEPGLIARDITDYIPQAFRKVW